MKKKIFVALLAACLIFPAAGFAMSHGDDGKKMDMDHGKTMSMDHDMDKMDHGKGHMGMAMDGKMMMLGTKEVDGVKGMAHLNDVHEQMAKHGMKQTHHLMIAFEDVSSGDAINDGMVAVKVEGPDGQVSDAIKLMGMEGHFGVDLTLDKKGTYKFMIGTKLADGTKRMFHYDFENK